MKHSLRYRWVFLWSFLGLLLERLLKNFWQAISVFVLYMALCFFGIPRLLGSSGHPLLFFTFTATMGYLCWRGYKQLIAPSCKEVERHIEKTTGFAHRPLLTLRDTLAAGQESPAQALWQKHINKIITALQKIKTYHPQSDLAQRDPFSLRHAAWLLLLIAYFSSGTNGWQTARENFFPSIAITASVFETKLDAWIVPPEYTHLAPVFLATSRADSSVITEPIIVPAGSMLKVRLQSALHPQKIRYGAAKIPLQKESDASFAADYILNEPSELKISYLLRTLGSWNIEVAADTPPELKLISTEKTSRSELKINYAAKDDYGFKRITGIITPAPSIEEKSPDASYADEDNEPIVFDMPPTAASNGETSFNIDLSWHLRAGLPATLKLTAEDEAGNTVATEETEITIPERTFTNPLALRLIESRKKLLTMRDPLSRRVIAEDIFDVGSRPGLYKGDITIFMALNVAARRLVANNNPGDIRSVQQILWHVAMKLEDGGLSLAARELSDALQKLSQALDNKELTQEQLDNLLAELQKKMQEYVNTLASEMSQRLQKNQKSPTISPEIAEKFLKHIDIKKMLDQFRELSKGNPREVMKKMSEYLKSMVDNIDLNKIDQMKKQQMDQMQALEDLQSLIHQQQSLLDRSSKADPSDNGKPEAGEQSALRSKLGDIMRKIGEGMPSIPDNFAKADQSMKMSEKALSSGHMKESVPHQQETLNQLQQSLDNTIQKMAEEMEQTMLTFGLSPQEGGYGNGFDPLGREDGTASGDGDIKIPDENERRRIQEIIQELRSRANDYQRPKVERDYIDRLLDQLN